jgi:hypothetical protein
MEEEEGQSAEEMAANLASYKEQLAQVRGDGCRRERCLGSVFIFQAMRLSV